MNFPIFMYFKLVYIVCNAFCAFTYSIGTMAMLPVNKLQMMDESMSNKEEKNCKVKKNWLTEVKRTKKWRFCLCGECRAEILLNYYFHSL